MTLHFKIKGWRMGQTIFNFLCWLDDSRHASKPKNIVMVDPFHIPDKEFKKLWNEYQKLHK